MFTASQTMFMRAARKFPTSPPRNMHEARFITIDKKNCLLTWKTRSQIDITLQDRTTTVTFPLRLRRDAGKLISCVREGGITSLKDGTESPVELRVGFDRGILYFAARDDSSSISTGLAPGDASLAMALIQHADKKRLTRNL
jgi:hypothetical protein